MSNETQYMMTEDGRLIPIPSTEPEPIEPVEEEGGYQPVPEPVPEPEEEDELADLFEVPQPEDNDMAIDHLLAPPEEVTEDDLSDLLEADGVMDEDYPGTPPSTETPETRRVPVKRFKRTPRRYPSPPRTMKGLRP